MYPERRPYATTVPHSGYRAKPMVPQPPADALAMLRAHVGYDDLRRGAHDEAEEGPGSSSSSSSPSMRTPAGRTYPSPTPNAHRLPPTMERTPQEALAAAQLQTPIEHDARTFHSCQQGLLNAELREKVEAQSTTRVTRVAAVQAVLSGLPVESTVLGSREAEALHKYVAAYRCTEDLAVPASAVVAQVGLHTPLEEVEGMTQLPPVPSDAMRRALDDMLRSPYLLAPLKTYVAKLSALDQLCGLAWSGEGPAAAPSMHSSTSSVVAKRAAAKEETELCPSRAAVALHERLHFNPGDFSERELKRSEEALMDLQQRVQAVKAQKEEAMDANDPVTALRSLHAQVDYSNDLLLLYKARMAQVGMHTDDAQDFRRDVVDLIDDARRAAQAVRAYAQKALPSVQHDINATANAIVASEQTLRDAQTAEAAAEAQVRERLTVMDGESRALWLEVLAMVEKIAAKAEERTRYVQQCMARREQRARGVAQAEAQLKAQEAHRERLRQCDEVLSRWEEVGDVYTKYVEACVPKLLKHVAAVEDADEDLSQREAEGYVAFFEQFVYAAEEARAKRRTQADRMRLLQRSVQLNHERAEDTLDPDAASHAQRLADATRELDEVQLYLKYVNEIEEERRAEVDPVLHRVLARHAQAQASNDGGDSQHDTTEPREKAAQIESSDHMAGAGDAEGASVKASPVKAAETPATAVVAAAPPSSAGDAAAAGEVAGAATMAHPLVAAREVGLAHEANYLQKQEQLTERELQELEGKMTGLRHSREELRALESKYQNGEAIRALLGLD